MFNYFAILLLLGLGYGCWSYYFVSTGLDNIDCKSKEEAKSQAELALTLYEGEARVIKTSGYSNSLSGFFKKGYTVIIEVDYNNLNKNDFVVYRYSKGLVLHRLRIKTDKGWIVEGDGNDAPDPILVTKDNLLGIVLHKKIYRY